MMTAIAYMIPFVAASGMLMVVGNIFGGTSVDTLNASTPLPSLLTTLGGTALGFIPIIVSTGISYSIADKAGIAPGVILGLLCKVDGYGFLGGLIAGLQLAKKQFSADNSNKYMIILTDGLPNLAVGFNDLVSYDGAKAVINQTKSTLNSLNNIEVITMLTGIAEDEASFRTTGTNTYTYGQVITEVFGTEDAPTKGKFLKLMIL